MFPLLIPENSIAVRGARDEVREAVAVYVFSVNEPRRSQIELRVKNPAAVARVGRRFKPAFRREDVRATVAIDVARPDAVPIALRAHFVFHPLGLGAGASEFVPCERGFFVAELRQDLLRFAGIQEVNQKRELHRVTGLDDGLAPGSLPAAWILVPGETIGEPSGCYQVGITVSVDVDGQVAEIVNVILAVVQGAKLMFDPLRSCSRRPGRALLVPVLARNDVELSVLVEVGHGAGLAWPEVNRVLAEVDFAGPSGSGPKTMPWNQGHGEQGRQGHSRLQEASGPSGHYWRALMGEVKMRSADRARFALKGHSRSLVFVYCFLTAVFFASVMPTSAANCLMKASPRCASSSEEGARSRQMAAAAASSRSGCANDSMVNQPS